MMETSTNNQDTQVAESKRVSFQTQQSMISGSTRKKYFLKIKKMHEQSFISDCSNRSNIFDLTMGNNNQEYSQISSNYNTISQSRAYSNSLFRSPSKQTLVQNPERKIVLPIITQSKYNFKPSIILPKVHKQKWHEKDPLYVQDAAKVDEKNIRKLKKYQKLWSNKSSFRSDVSLLDRSEEKAQKYIEKHNSDIICRKASISFQTILRDRHIKQQNRIGTLKGVPCRSLPGLKGKGGSVKSLFQQVFEVEQMYKFDK